jgi:glycosyltransferase involved in cell wall biosynthesis
MHDTPSRPWRRSDLYPRLIGLVHRTLGTKLIFLSQSERADAGWTGKGKRVCVVPHYIEERAITAALPIDPLALRLGVVGFIDPRKQPLFLLEVLRLLPGALLTFLGGPLPGEEELTRRLELESARLQLGPRVRICGPLSERDLDRELGGTDIGLCLYSRAATSASLATLLAARRPVVASDLPIFREHATLAPRAITIVEMEPHRVAEAILDLARRPADWLTELERLLDDRSTPNFGAALWRAAISPRPATTSGRPSAPADSPHPPTKSPALVGAASDAARVRPRDHGTSMAPTGP